MAALAAALAVLVGAANAQGSLQSAAYTRGLEHEQAGRYREAAAAYKEALAAEPASASALLGLERAFAELGMTDSLLPAVEAAIRARPAEAVPRTVQLRALRTIGAAARLREAFERWTRDWPRDPVPYREYARLLIQAGQTLAADSVLRRAQAALGTGRGFEFEIAQLRASMGLWDLAAEAWRGAIAGAPYLEQAAVYSLVPTPAASRDAVRRTLAAAPATVGARKVLALLELEWGLASRGWQALRDLPADSAARGAWLEFATRAEGSGAWLEARDALVAALGSAPTPALAARAATNALRGGDAQSAAALAALGARDASRRTVARLLLPVHVRALSDLGRAEEAERLVTAYDDVLSAEQRASLVRAVAFGWVRAGDVTRARAMLRDGGGARGDGEAAGWLALYDGDLRAARRALRADAGSSPELVTALALLARTRADTAPRAGRAFLALARGDTAIAAAAFEEAASELAEAAPLLLSVSARLHAARREDDRAIAIWRAIAERHPEAAEAPEANLEWARTLRRRGKTAEAIERLEHLILTYPRSALVPQARRELELARGMIPSTA